MEKKVKRIKPCAVCRQEAREGIERAVLRGESVRMIAGRFTVLGRCSATRRITWPGRWRPF